MAFVKQYIVQAVVEVPMSRRQARSGIDAAFQFGQSYGVRDISLTGYSILRGLTFVEMAMDIDDEADMKDAARVALAHFVVEAEGAARGGESEEFALAFAEGFLAGREHEPEALLLPKGSEAIGIGGTDEGRDAEWARLLSRYYNPAARAPGEVNIRKTKA
jgi:hypothetical protein